MNPILRGPRVVLRPVVENDLPQLIEILREPAVARHWSEPDEAFDRQELLAGDHPDGAGPVTTFVIDLAGETIGWIGAWENLHRDYRHAGIDLFVAPQHHGRGLGSEAIRLVCQWLFAVRGHHRITIDPAADNAAAIRAYEKVGFRRVGTLRQYERGPDGAWHDGLLMELLCGELVECV